MKRQSGISLIEQLVTLLVTSTAVLGVAKFQANMFDAELNSKQRAEAVSLAQQQLEVLRSAGYESTATSSNDSITGTTTHFSRSWTVAPDDSLEYNVSSVTVAWSTKGSNNSVILNSRIAKISQAESGRLMLGQYGPGSTLDSAPAVSPSVVPAIGVPTGDVAAAPTSSSSPSSPDGSPSDGNDPDPNPECAAGTLSVGACSYTLGGQAGGWAGAVATTTSGYTGSAMASCSGGQWSLSGVTCTPAPVTCDCTKSRHGQSFKYSVASGQDARCTVAVCSAAPNQCAPSNNESCTFNASVSQ